MSKRISVKELFALPPTGEMVEVAGWVRTFRSNRFIALSDGSTIKTFQILVDFEKFPDELLKQITTGAAIIAKGKIVPSQGAGQAIEMQAESIEVTGPADPEKYPLQPKRHSMEFLREIAHLRMRTNTFGAIMRVRHVLAFAIHKFFHERGFFYLQ